MIWLYKSNRAKLLQGSEPASTTYGLVTLNLHIDCSSHQYLTPPNPACLCPLYNCTLSIIFVTVFRLCTYSLCISKKQWISNNLVAFTVHSTHFSVSSLQLSWNHVRWPQSMRKQHNNAKMCTDLMFRLLSIFIDIPYKVHTRPFRINLGWLICSPYIYHLRFPNAFFVFCLIFIFGRTNRWYRILLKIGKEKEKNKYIGDSYRWY